jgi:hypothetical protein
VAWYPRDNATEEELDAMIAQQRANLPPWWYEENNLVLTRQEEAAIHRSRGFRGIIVYRRTCKRRGGHPIGD